MKRRLFALCLALLLCVLAACGSKSGPQQVPSTPSASNETAGDYGGSGFEGEQFAPQSRETSPVYLDENAKLIRRASLEVQTEGFDQAVQTLDQLVARCSGYFESASVEGGSLRDTSATRYGCYTIRIPAEQYEAFLNQTGTLGYVSSRRESSQDVGEQYYDTQARLKTQRTKQERLLELLAKADTMEGIIALESALSEVEYEIEQLSSTLNRYDSLVSYATVELSLQEVHRVQEQVGEAGSLGARMGAGVAASFQGLIRGAQGILVFLSYHFFAVLLLAAAAAAGVVVWRGKMRRAGGARPPAEHKDESQNS